MRTLVPGGAIGVALKLKLPCMKAHADSLGFVLAERRRFSVMFA